MATYKYNPQVAQQQAALNAANKTTTGYTPLKVDGFLGPLTKAAVANYSNPTPDSLTVNPNDNPKAIGPNPIIANQQNLVQSSASERAKQNATGTEISNIENNIQTKDANGNIINNNQNQTQTPNQNTTVVDTTTPPGNVKDSLGGTYSTSMPENTTYDLPILENGNKWVYDLSGRALEMDAKGNVINNPLADKEYNITKQTEKDKATFDANIETLKANVSAAHQNLLDSIKVKSAEQKTAMNEINKKYLGSKTVSGFRTGATEYTPEIAMGILKNEEEEGLKRIKEIDDSMNILLAKAISAKNDKDLEIAQATFDKYTTLRKEKENAIIDQYKMYIENQKFIEEKRKNLINEKKVNETEARAKTDQAIQELNIAAPQLVKDYASASNKDAFINSLVKSTGLDKEMILGAITKATPKPVTPKAPNVVKPFFSPTASDKSTVAIYASKNPEIDEKKLETDSEYFYWVLSSAKTEAEAKKKKTSTRAS